MNESKLSNMVRRNSHLNNGVRSFKLKPGLFERLPHNGILNHMTLYILLLSLGFFLFLFTSCSISAQKHPKELSPAADKISNAGTIKSSSDETPAPTVNDDNGQIFENESANFDEQKPDSPFPDFPPNRLQFIAQWLWDDIKNGNLAVGEDGVTVNYQAWYEFIGKLTRNEDSALTIQEFSIDKSKDIIDKTRYQKGGRYYLSVKDNEAVWQDLTENRSYVTGKFSSAYNDKTGLHEIFIGDKKVFEFIYFPYDPRQCALYFGHMPIEKLPRDYTEDDAIKDGCLVIEQGIIQNIDVLDNFVDSFKNYYDTGIFLRIYLEDDNGITIMDVGSYNERVCIVEDYSRNTGLSSVKDIYETTYYDNYTVSVDSENGVYSLALVSDEFETIYIFKDAGIKK